MECNEYFTTWPLTSINNQEVIGSNVVDTMAIPSPEEPMNNGREVSLNFASGSFEDGNAPNLEYTNWMTATHLLDDFVGLRCYDSGFHPDNTPQHSGHTAEMQALVPRQVHETLQDELYQMPLPHSLLHSYPLRDIHSSETAAQDHGSESQLDFQPSNACLQSSAQQKEIRSLLIGSVYSTSEPNTNIIRCDDPGCKKKTFGRWNDFKRHYNGAHARTPIVYWCGVAGCSRSKAAGDRPFPRKDKLNDHIESMHHSEL